MNKFTTREQETIAQINAIRRQHEQNPASSYDNLFMAIEPFAKVVTSEMALWLYDNSGAYSDFEDCIRAVFWDVLPALIKFSLLVSLPDADPCNHPLRSCDICELLNTYEPVELEPMVPYFCLSESDLTPKTQAEKDFLEIVLGIMASQKSFHEIMSQVE